MDGNYQKRHKLNSEGKQFTKNKASTTSHIWNSVVLQCC